GGDAFGGLRDLAGMPAAWRPPAGEVDGIRVLEAELGLLHVPRYVHEDGAAAAGAGDVERRLQHLRQLRRLLHEPGVLDDRDREAGDVALLKGVGADLMRSHLAGDA